MTKTTENFLKSLPIVASQLGNKLGVKVELGNGASTNGETITLPWTVDEQSTSREELLGFLVHEASHVRHTSMYALRRLVGFPPIAFGLTNALEDARIEQLITSEYAGARYLLDEAHKSCHEQILKSDFKANPPTAFSMYPLFAAEASYHPQMAPYAEVFRRQCVKHFGESIVSDVDRVLADYPKLRSTDDTVDMALKLLEILEKALPPEEEPQQQDEQDDSQNSDDSSDSEDQNDASQGEGGQGSQSQDPSSDQGNDGNQNPEASDQGNQNPFNTQNPSGSSSDQQSGESGQEGDGSRDTSGSSSDGNAGEGDEGSEDSESESDQSSDQSSDQDAQSNGGSSSDTSKKGDRQSKRIGKSIARTLSGRARIDTSVNPGEALKTKLNKEASIDPNSDKELTCGNIEATVPMVCAEYLKEEKLDPKYSELGQLRLNEARKQSIKARKALLSMVQAKARTGFYIADSGRRVSARCLHRINVGNTRIFEKRDEVVGTNTTVSLLLDLSGSVEGDEETVITAGLAMIEALRGIQGVKAQMEVFPACANHFIPYGCGALNVVVPFGHDPRKYTREIGTLTTGGGTPLPQALIQTAMQLQSRPESRHIIIVVTDGWVTSDAQLIIQKLLKSGVTVVGIGVGGVIEECFDGIFPIWEILPFEGLGEALMKVSRRLMLEGFQPR